MSKQPFRIAVAEKLTRLGNSSEEFHVDNKIDHEKD